MRTVVLALMCLVAVGFVGVALLAPDGRADTRDVYAVTPTGEGAFR